jgi:DUF1365 family protein
MRAEGGSALYFGTVRHARLRPVRHRFSHRIFSLYLDLDEQPALARCLRLLAFNRPGVLAFHERDHGAGDGTPLRRWVERHLERAGLAGAGHRIRLLCFPRLLGFVFNPLSVYYCFDRAERLRAVLYEVNNTFGERHSYLLAAAPDGGATFEQATAKRLHVSPFLGMAATYRFRAAVPGERLHLVIGVEAPEGPVLATSIAGRRRPLSDRSLALALLRAPFLQFRVIGLIHWHALRLWLKGAPLFPRPPAPAAEVSHDVPASADRRAAE